MLRLMTAGESHGKALVAILDGVPAGLGGDLENVKRDLSRRESGDGGGGRKRIKEKTPGII